jgi:methionyl-tRNA synthetase
MDDLLAHCHFKDGIKAAMTLAQEANRYLDEKSPWKAIKTDRTAAATSLYVVINVLAALRTMLYPYLPFSSQKLHEYLGYSGSVQAHGWQIAPPPGGQKLLPPYPLFTKLEDKLLDEELERLVQSMEK